MAPFRRTGLPLEAPPLTFEFELQREQRRQGQWELEFLVVEYGRTALFNRRQRLREVFSMRVMVK